MKIPNWVSEAIFYHIYPLGLLGCPSKNEGSGPIQSSLPRLIPWLDHIRSIGGNALYLGPLFESESHGYDTRDYFQVDRRLGTNEDLSNLVREAHARGIKVVLDGVFNHSGRSFPAFQDLLRNGRHSSRQDWYAGIQHGQSSPLGDPFNYETWNGYSSLPKFNLSNPQLREHLFEAVEYWVETFKIDGLRLDAADQIQLDFWQELRARISSRHPEFWLMGELVHNDYRNWVNSHSFHSATNYEAYKGLFSSFNDHNFFEIAHTLQRQFGEGGLYHDLLLYNFVDNHDVNRIASQLGESVHLYPLYGLLFSMPGIPSIYYGSEFGIQGKRSPSSDAALRPALDLPSLQQSAPQPELVGAIRKFAALRKKYPALQTGTYRQALVQSLQLAFWRETPHQKLLVAINAAPEPVKLGEIPLPRDHQSHDPLDPNSSGRTGILEVPGNWIKVLVFED